MSNLRTAAQQALAFTMRDFASLRDFEAAKAVLHDNLRAALAQQAEPVAWDVTKDGRLIYDYDFTHDVSLRVMGDFEDDEQRVRYAKQIVDKLNAIPPRRTMVPLTEDEIWALYFSLPSDDFEQSDRVDFARAVEKASWEKNHG